MATRFATSLYSRTREADFIKKNSKQRWEIETRIFKTPFSVTASLFFLAKNVTHTSRENN